MNSSSLEKEIKEYSEYNKQGIVTISKLSDFFKTFSQQGKKFAKSSQNALDDFYHELIKENIYSTFYTTYYCFYENFKNYLKLLEDNFDEFDKKLGQSIEEYETSYKNSYGEAINSFNNLLNVINEKKDILEKDKFTYFESCKSYLDIENKMMHLEDNKTVTPEQVAKINEQFSKSYKIMENFENVYKNGIKEINTIYENNEENYANIIKKFRTINIEKIRFFIRVLKNIYLCTNQFIDNQKEPIIKLEKIADNIKVNRDIILYDEKFNYYNDNKKRFLFVQFLDYKKFKKNTSNIEKQDNKTPEGSNNSSTFGSLFGFFKRGSVSSTEGNSANENKSPEETIKKEIREKVLNLGKNDNSFIEEDDEAKADNLFIKYLLENKEKMDEEKINNMMDKLKKNDNNLINFMSVLITYYKLNKIIKVQNYDNLKHLSIILDLVLNICIKKQSLFDICYMIIFVAEKTLYINENKGHIKEYLYKNLSQNTAFQQKEFWNQLIDEKIKMLADKNVKTEIAKKEKQKENEGSNTMLSGFKNYFLNNKAKENQKLEDEIFSLQLYEEKLLIYAVEILKEYIHHFSSFHFDHTKSSELITDLSIRYKFKNNYVDLFIKQLNSNLHSPKNDKQLLSKEGEKIDYNKLFFNTDKKKYEKISDKKIICLIHSLKFIQLKELPNLLCLNKTYNKSLLKIIYKNILIKYSDMDIKTHIYIWKIILGCSETKKEHNYKNILEEIKKNPNKIPSNEIIRLDSNRTTFEKDKEINREKIYRILNALSLCTPDFHYCQGMNFIAAFFLNIFGDEEEAFYIFLSLLLTSDYGSLFTKEFANLKKYFYVLERIIEILLPELYNYLKVTNVKVSFFASSWFITLFTDTYLNIKNRDNPKVLLRILDLFLFKGYKSILKVGIVLLKHFEYKIMSLSFEELLRFLITDMPKSEFFQNSSYDNLMNTFLNFKIESILINNIEKEYKIRESLEKGKI
jgi:hypothetical protein